MENHGTLFPARLRGGVVPGIFGAFCFLIAACAPQVVRIIPEEGPPGSLVNLSIDNLVGWPRVEIGGHTLDFYQLKLIARDPERAHLPGEELFWTEDKILQFRVPPLHPGDYPITIYDDKGPPGDKVYSFLETGVQLIFPPTWPYVLRSNQARTSFRVLAPGRP